MDLRTRKIKSLLPDWKQKNQMFDLRICPDCNTLQIMKPMIEGSKCDGAGVPLFCDSVVIICTKGKNRGKLMWYNENWE